MQKRILFFAISLMFTWTAKAGDNSLDNAKLDACFSTTAGFFALQVGCAQIKTAMGSNFPLPDADCKTVTGTRQLGLFFQNNPPRVGSLNYEKNVTYVNLYTQKAVPEYISKCFPKPGGTTAGSTGTTARNAGGNVNGGTAGGTNGTNAGANGGQTTGQTGGQKKGTDATAGKDADGKNKDGGTGKVAEKDDQDAARSGKASAATGETDDEAIAAHLKSVGAIDPTTGERVAPAAGAGKAVTKSDTGTPAGLNTGEFLNQREGPNGEPPGTLIFSSEGEVVGSYSERLAFRATATPGGGDDDTTPVAGGFDGPTGDNKVLFQLPASGNGVPTVDPAAANKVQSGIEALKANPDYSEAEFKDLKGDLNKDAFNSIKSATQNVYNAGVPWGAASFASGIKSGVETYIKTSETCADAAEMAKKGCIEENSPAVKQTLEAMRILAPVLQTATGMNDSCNKISRAMGKVNKGMLLATAVCGAFQGYCNVMCGTNKQQLEAIRNAIQSASTGIQMTADDTTGAWCAAAAAACTSNSPSCPANKSKCEYYQKERTKSQNLLKTAMNEFEKGWGSETNPKGQLSLLGRVNTCGSFTDTLRKTAQGLLSVAQTNMQAKDCAKKTANNDNPNKCQDPNYEGSMECLCQRAEFKNTNSCREYTTGCAVAGQMKNAAGTCVAITEACKDAVNAAKPECTTTVVGHCMDPANANNKECMCLVNPNSVACGGNGNTVLNGGLTAGTTGTTNNIVPTDTNTNTNSPFVDGGGLQKMGNDGRTTSVANLNGLRAGADRMNLGTDGANNNLGPDGQPIAYSDPLAGGSSAAGGGASGGGLGAWGGGGRDPASDPNAKGKAGGYKGASAEALGGGGGWGGGGLNWGDREKNKNEALQKLNAAREKARLAGLTVLKENGITGPTGQTLWDKVKVRYRENKSTLIGE